MAGFTSCSLCRKERSTIEESCGPPKGGCDETRECPRPRTLNIRNDEHKGSNKPSIRNADLSGGRRLRLVGLTHDQPLGGSGGHVLEREADLRGAVLDQPLSALVAVRLNAGSDHQEGRLGELGAQAFARPARVL